MDTQASVVHEKEFLFTDEDFELIRNLVREHIGIKLSEAKRDMVYGRLVRRLRQLKLNSFRSYLQILEGDSGDELIQFTNALTTNLTAFFREPHHFEYMASKLLPELLQRKASERRLRIWSAGCSTGEEPYSIAMVIRENLPASSRWDIKILATDLDSSVLEKAAVGVYAEERIQAMSPVRARRWFLRGKGENSGKVRVRPELRELVHFRQLNLLQGWPMRGPFDIIFCRNVVIYFDKETQKTLFDRYADIMVPDGHLFLGHSESLFKVTDRFHLLGNTIYQRVK